MRRRQLLLGAVGTLGAGPLLKAASGTGTVHLPLIIDGLGGLEDPNLEPGQDGEEVWTEAMFRDLKASRLTALNMTIGHVFGPGEPFEMTVREIARALQKLRAHPKLLALVQSGAELRACRGRGRVGVILGFQNTLMMGDRVDRVGLFADLGVKVVQLTYNDRNHAGDGSMVAENLGLTEFGRSLVAELNRTRTLVDLSHSGERTCLEAITASRAPVTISHTGCRALMDHPRNKTDQELRLLADRGGVVGIYFMPYLHAGGAPRAEDVVRHLEHAVQVCGEDHVALGTDGSTTAIRDLEGLRRAAEADMARRREAGIAAPGEVPGRPAAGGGSVRPGPVRQAGADAPGPGPCHRPGRKIMGANLLRLYTQVWGA